MKKMIVLNHKMYLEYDEIPLYIDKLNKIDTDNSIVVIPSSIYLESFMHIVPSFDYFSSSFDSSCMDSSSFDYFQIDFLP